MNPITHIRNRRIIAVVLTTIVALVFSGCSRKDRAARMLKQANIEFDAGALEKAEIGYKNVLQLDGTSGAAFARLGQIYYDQGREYRALPLLLKAKDLSPDNLDARLRLGLFYLTAGNTKGARDEAVYILDHNPRHAQAPQMLAASASTDEEIAEARKRLQALPSAETAPVLVGLGVVAVRSGQPAEAEALFTKAQAADPKSEAAPASLGLLYWAQNKLPEAEAALKKAADLSPVRSPKRIKYAQFKIQTRDIPVAKNVLAEMTKATPDFLPAWVWLAEIAAGERNFPECEAILAKISARDAAYPDAMLLAARVKLATNQTDAAIKDLEKMLSLFPNSPQVAYQLGLAYSLAGDQAKAGRMFQQAVTSAPKMEHAILALAEINIHRRDFAPAITALKQLSAERPDLPMARALLAEAYRSQGSFNEATAIYGELEKQFPSDPQAPFWRGMVLLQQDQRAEARKAFERVRELLPQNLAVLETLLDLDLRDKNPKGALQRIEAECEKNPGNPDLHILRSHILFAAGDSNGSEAALKKAIELKPDSIVAHFTQARMYVTVKKFDEALAAIDRVIALDPKYTAAHLLAGVVHDGRKNYPGARDAYEKVIALDPKNSLALNNLACLYTDQLNQPDKAVELAQRARALTPNDPGSADTLGWALTKKQRYAQAVPLLQECVGKLPEVAEAHYHLGVARYMLGDEEAAQASLERALQLNATFPGAADAHDRLALLKIDPATITPAARETIEKRLASNPSDPSALLRAGELARGAGDVDAALARYKAILQINPKHALALINAARIYAAKRDLPKALENAKAARNAAPGNLDIAHTVGRIAYDAGDQRWAASLLQEAAKARPEDAEVLFDWAEAAYSIGRVSDADISARHALELKPFTRTAAAERFVALLSLCADPAKASGAAGTIDQALKSDPLYAPALMARALLAEQKPDASAARQNYEKLLGQCPDFSPAQRNLAILYAADPAENIKALAIANKARQAFPNDPTLARAIGILSYRQGEFGKAANFLLEAAANIKNDSEALYYLGMAQSRLNKRSESKQTLQRALELGLKDTLANEAKKTLASVD